MAASQVSGLSHRREEITRWELTILIAEAVGGPHTAVTIGAVDSVNKAIAFRLLGKLASVVWVAEQSRWHARPESKYDEGQQVAEGHGPPPLLIGIRSKSGGQLSPVSTNRATSVLLLNLLSGTGCRDIVEDDQVKDRAGNVDERVCLVRPSHKLGSLKKPILHGRLNENAQSLFHVNNLEGMLASGVDC